MAKDNEVVLTPMMKQYFDLKAKHPDAIMLFRCGDFYETYSEDAVAAAEDFRNHLDKTCQRSKQNGGDGGVPPSCTRYLPA